MLQGLQAGFVHLRRKAKFFHPLFPAFLQAFVFRLLELAFADKGIGFFGGEGRGAAAFFALCLGSLQGLAGGV